MSSQVRPPVRPLEAGDADWVADLARTRRETLVPHAPRFWRPAPDADVRHRAFLGRLVDDDAVLGLRTDRGFLVAVPGSGRYVVDDWAVEPSPEDDDAWATDGVALLAVALERLGRLRVVVPAFEAARVDAVASLGLRPVEAWWHRDLPPVQVTAEAGPVRLDAAGSTGRLVPAPPVYDPGGPVLFVSDVGTGAGLAALEDDAARRGATVAVVTQRPDDLMRELLLVSAGYTLTTRFCETPDDPQG